MDPIDWALAVFSVIASALIYVDIHMWKHRGR